MLDARDVPDYVVGFVVFHEMLHAALEPDLGDGRRRFHTDEFKDRERSHPDHVAAESWIRSNVHALLSY